MKEERCDKTGFCASFPWVYTSDDGKYVLHADYAALQAENERLREAGDAMAEIIDFGDDNETMQSEWEAAALAKWLAAKGVES